MNGLENREKGFEAKYRLDEETRFKIAARRNKPLGLWAAERMGLSGASADEYAKDVVMADFIKPGDEDVLDKVLKDLTAKGLDTTGVQIRNQMDKLTETARIQILKQTGIETED